MIAMEKRYAIITISITVIASILLVYTFGIINRPSILTDRGKRSILYEKATIISVKSEQLTEDPSIDGIKLGYQEVELQILTGPYKNQKFKIKNSMSRLYNVHTKQDMEVIAGIFINNNQISDVSIYTYKRDKVIYILTILFFLIILFVGKMKGFKSIISLIFTGVMVIFFMIPLVFKGFSPISAAILTATITTIMTHLIITGYNRKSFSAMLGTILGSVIAGLICYTAGNLAHLSGLTMDNAENLILIAENSKFQVRGLMFAAILIASLGAIMDVGMSIASSISEIHSVNPKVSKKELFNSGMNVGKDIIGTMSNTLILAFAGSALPMIIMIMASNMPFTQIINMDVIATELIQSLSGSIGIVLTVPLTALISVAFLDRKVLGNPKEAMKKNRSRNIS
jgi:uncharacterized membrane protein